MIARRVWLACTTTPTPRDIAEGALALALFAALSALLGAATGLLHYAPRPADEVALLALRALLIPALGEEFVFRAMLVPSRDEAPNALRPIALSVVLFAAWHVVETLFLPGSAATFLRADFLALAALLGLLCAILRWRSGSIWTAVALHWIIVVAWQGWFGGPSFGIPN
ncbi:MAG: CPBP family glutamic-type intramembrane protease [Terricaulis sp.]